MEEKKSYKLVYLLKNANSTPFILYVKKYLNDKINSKVIEFVKTDGDTVYFRLLLRTEEEREHYRAAIKAKFDLINSQVVESNCPPLFPDTTDLKRCIAIKEDILKMVPVSELFKFFGATLRDYVSKGPNDPA